MAAEWTEDSVETSSGDGCVGVCGVGVVMVIDDDFVML